MWYWWRIVKPTVILRCRAQFSSSIVDFATNTNVGKSHSYGSIYSFQTRPQYAACTFSILNRIDIPATQNNSSILNKCVKLSVSSTGSISLQLIAAPIYRSNQESFSILNRIDLPATLKFIVLKLPDTGLFQYPQPDRSPCNLVQWFKCDQRPTHTNFQYPQPDRSPCNDD